MRDPAGRCAVALLAIGATFVESCRSAVVVYDNAGGEFQWTLSEQFANGQTASLGTFLDITQSPSQSTERRAGALGQWFRWNSSGSEPALRFIEGASKSDFEQIPTIKQTLEWNGSTIKPITLRQYEVGQTTSTSDGWDWQGVYFFHLPSSKNLDAGTPAIDELSYVGVRVRKNGNYHYGWILFEDYTTPIAWAYESTPNTMITVPAPLTATMLALPLLVHPQRRRFSGR